MIGKLIALAKSLKEMGGVINVSTISPSVLLTKEAFAELFPKWTDTTSGVNDDGVPFEIRHITLDGVTFECVAYDKGEE